MILKWPSSGLGIAPALPVLHTPVWAAAALSPGWQEGLWCALLSCTAEPCPGKQKPQVSTGSGTLLPVDPSPTLPASTRRSANGRRGVSLRCLGAAFTQERLCCAALRPAGRQCWNPPPSTSGKTPASCPRGGLQHAARPVNG